MDEHSLKNQFAPVQAEVTASRARTREAGRDSNLERGRITAGQRRQLRLEAAKIRRDEGYEASRAFVADIIETPPACVMAMHLDKVLSWCGMRDRREHLMDLAGVPYAKLVGDMTVRQREAIGEEVRGVCPRAGSGKWRAA